MVGARLLSFDVEHWYDATLASKPASAQPEYARREIDAVLELLAARGVRATFFVLGGLARQLPASVRDIAAAGHEVGCHGLTHELLFELGEARMRREVGAARSILQELCGQEVVGYRAPTWSLDRRSAWAPRVLHELGFRYDSSVFPLRTPFYGVPGAPVGPYRLKAGDGWLLELPPAVREVLGVRVPLAGGIYWRVLPAALVTLGLRGMQLPVLYAHPWEVAPAGWSLPSGSGALARFGMGFRGRQLGPVLGRLLRTGSFQPLGDALRDLDGSALPAWGFQDGRIAQLPH